MGCLLLSFLDAFFVVSYTATTIGFGEIPHPFTAQQKMWMLFVMYSTVIAWLYAIGSVLSVISDPGFVGFAPTSARSVGFRPISNRFGLFVDMAVRVIK